MAEATVAGRAPIPPPRLKETTIVAIVYVAGFFMSLLDSTIVTVSLPAIASDFSEPTASLEWVVTGYLLSLAVFIPASGWFGDRFGTKRVYLFALTLFTACSLLVGLAQSPGQLVAARILQGVGGGMLTPVGMTMLYRVFPPERRRVAAKVLIIPTAAAPALGPIVGGFFVDHLTWRWAFLINLPIGIAVIAFGALMLRDHREAAGRFDALGFVLSGSGLAMLLYALSEGPSGGWLSPQVLGALALSAIAISMLVVVELRIDAPMLRFRLLHDRLFRATTIGMLFSSGTFISTLFLMPQLLQDVLGLSAMESGLTTFFEAVGVLSVSQIASRAYARIGPRRLMMFGMTLMACMLVALSRVGLDTSLWTIRAEMYLLGASYSCMIMSLQTATFATISPADTGRASAMYSAARQTAGALGVAITASALSAFLPDGGSSVGSPESMEAFRRTFLVGAAIAVLGVVASSRVVDADAQATFRRG